MVTSTLVVPARSLARHQLVLADGRDQPLVGELSTPALEGSTRRAIDFHEGESIDEQPLKPLVRAAVALNESTAER
jgi:hypothetical protein